MEGEQLEGSRHLPHTATTATSSMACSLPGPWDLLPLWGLTQSISSCPKLLKR